MTFDSKNYNQHHTNLVNNHINSVQVNHKNSLNLKNITSPELPGINNNNNIENQKVKEKTVNLSKIQNTTNEKHTVKINIVKSNSNKSLPSAQLSDDEKVMEVYNNNKTEGNEYYNKKKTSNKDLKNKTFHDNKIYKTKVNFVDKVADKNSIMNQTNYYSNSSRTNDNNNLLQSTGSLKNYEYKYKKINIQKAKQTIIDKNNFSVEKLEPDFNFKKTQIHFDPFNNPRNNNKFVFAPMLRYIIFK